MAEAPAKRNETSGERRTAITAATINRFVTGSGPVRWTLAQALHSCQ